LSIANPWKTVHGPNATPPIQAACNVSLNSTSYGDFCDIQISSQDFIMRIKTHALSLVVGLVLISPVVAQPTFNFDITTFQSGGFGLSENQFLQAFQDGADLWSERFTDDVTINVELQLINGTFLAGTDTNFANHSYASVVAAMTADANSVSDFQAVSSLQSGASYDLMINRTSQNGNSASSYLDNNGSFNNSNVQLTDANAMALGLADPNLGGRDMLIIVGNDPGGLSGLISWDTDRSDDIGILSIDLIGVAAHELAHGMGFISNVDLLDENTGISEDGVTATIPDLFRFSNASAALGDGILDMSVDTSDKYFSLDGGVTSLGQFSTGINNGDGRQASHWKDDALSGTHLGLMDPTIDLGVITSISDLDIALLDVAGWTLAVPEPSSALALGWLCVGLSIRRRRRPTEV
jgi:hypothetical protein